MKIHIDTSSAEEQAKAQKVKSGTSKGKGTASSAQKSGGKQQGAAGQQPAMPGQQQQKPKPTRPLTKKPPNEPRAPKDVQAARKQQTAMLKARQDRETQGKQSSFQRDADVGAGFWPPIALW